MRNLRVHACAQTYLPAIAAAVFILLIGLRYLVPSAPQQVFLPKLSLKRAGSTTGPNATEPAGSGTPDDFDWEAYKFYNPDLDLSSLSEAEARQHYVQVGRREGRIGRRLPLFLTYLGYGGLCNQLLGHLIGPSLAYALNATALTAHAYKRSSFQTDAHFTPQPLETILDLGAWAGYWRGLGVQILKEANTSECAYIDLLAREPGNHYHLTKYIGEGDGSWRGEGPKPTLPEASARLATFISAAVQPQLAANPAAAPCVHVYIGNPGNILDLPRTQHSLPPITVQAFPFAPEVVRAAETVLSAIAQSHKSFWGVHLRIESDWSSRLETGATKKGPIGAYIDAMRSANFSHTTPVYFASAIFDYDSEAVGELRSKVKMHMVSGAVLYKLALVPPDTFAGFHSEQLALVDLIVLSGAERFVGDSRSSFSMFLREYRLLRGLPRDTFFPVSNETFMEIKTRFAQPP